MFSICSYQRGNLKKKVDNHLPLRSQWRPFGGQSSADVLALWQQSWPKHTHGSRQVTALLHLVLCQEAHGVKRGAEVAAVEGCLRTRACALRKLAFISSAGRNDFCLSALLAH